MTRDYYQAKVKTTSGSNIVQTYTCASKPYHNNNIITQLSVFCKHYLCMMVLAIFAITTLNACSAFKESVNSTFIEPFNAPSPSEASTWMFSRDPEKRRTGISLISNAPFGGEEPYLKVYREAVTDLDPMVRAAATHGLALHGEVQDAKQLVILLSDNSRLVRLESAKGLQRIHYPDAVSTLLAVLKDDVDTDVRMAVAAALGQYQQRLVIDGLIKAIDDRSLGVNYQARKSLITLTGCTIGYDTFQWRDWYKNTDDPFANARTYKYPVFTRDLKWYEKISPFSRKNYENPNTPVGLPTDENTNTGS